MHGNVRLGVDIGGTFTDLYLDTPGGPVSLKVLTTRQAPEDGVIAGLEELLARAGLAPADLGLVIHGTTLATNALIERKGARTALLTTEGYRDTLEIASESRFDVYDVDLDLPRPLVPRSLRLEVAERVAADGSVLRPLDEPGVERLIDEVLRPGTIEAVAVGLVHAYANPAHEQRIAEMLRAALPDLAISLSSEVSPEMREYERFSTTVANAYVQPLMDRYLGRLEDRLRGLGIRAPLLLMLSGGGVTTVGTARRFPVRLVESGPAGGVIFASGVARDRGLDRVVSFDMGGTTAKLCLVDEGEARSARSFEVARIYRFRKGSGLPLRIPVIEMVEIGDGGGSIARVDDLGRIAVGPASAGSEPGPVCYGRGGEQPTVTDADLVLGRIDPALFSGGRIGLDAAGARAALDETIGAKLALSPELAAFGVVEMVDNNMASAARVHAIESGVDVAGRTLVAFGGAAPLHAARIADHLGIDRVLIPESAGVGSCVGFLRAPIAFEIVRSGYWRLAGFDATAANRLLAELEAEALAVVRPAAGAGTQITARRMVYMRYVGQGHEIAVELPADGEIAGDLLLEAFGRTYERQYDRRIPGVDVETISWGVTLSTPLQAAGQPVTAAERHAAAPVGRRQVFSPDLERTIEVAVHDRAELRPGAVVEGPAIIVEAQTSTVVPEGFGAFVDGFGHIELVRGPAQED